MVIIILGTAKFFGIRIIILPSGFILIQFVVMTLMGQMIVMVVVVMLMVIVMMALLVAPVSKLDH